MNARVPVNAPEARCRTRSCLLRGEPVFTNRSFFFSRLWTREPLSDTVVENDKHEARESASLLPRTGLEAIVEPAGNSVIREA